MESPATETRATMDEITALAKRRGFIFQSSEIYGGINGFWDYGPLGAILKRNVKNAWWRDTVEMRDDVVAFDSSIIMHPLTWKASGHIDAFHDKLVDCKVCKHRFRFDHLEESEPVSGLRQQKQLHRAAQLQSDDEDADRSDGRQRVGCISAPGNRSGHLRQLQKRLPDGAQEAAVRHRADRQVVSQRNHAGQLHVSECANSNRPSLSISCPTTATTWRRSRNGSSCVKAWYSKYGVKPDRLRFYELHAARAPALREGRHRRRVSISVGLG